MIIDQSEHLRIWLSQVLQPLCDADPNALAKYVLALIRKDKEEEELKQCMIDQLDVFLQLETKGFVTRLFKVLKTKEYLPGARSSTMETENSGEESTSDMDISLSCGSLVDSLSGNSPRNSAAPSDDEASASSKSVPDDKGTPGSTSSSRSIKKESEEKERDRSRRNKSRSPRRGSRSRSRGRMSRSPRDHRGRYRAGKSSGQKQRHDRDVWDRRRSPGARNRSASPRRSSPRYRRPYNSRSPRSRSPRSPREGKDSVTTRFVEAKVPEAVETKPAIQSVIQQVGLDGKLDITKDEFGRGIRCRDYDEQGLCMRGELCPFDHGVNPVILEDVNNPALKDKYQVELPMGFSPRMMRARPMFAEPPMMDNMNMGWGPQPFRPRHMMMMGGLGVRPGMMRFPPPQQPRSLVDVPVVGVPAPQMPTVANVDMNSMRGMPRMRGYYGGMGRGRGRGGFDRGRLGAKPTRNNCLEVKKIPREKNNIMELNSHFWKFGKIVNIQINFDNDPEAALITYSTPEEAYTAYKSTDAVMNNRFIRVFWHNKEKENEEADEGPPGVSPQSSIRDRLGDQAETGVENMEEGKIIMSGNNLTKTLYNYVPAAKKEISAERAEQVEAIKKSQEMLAAQETLRKAQEEKKKEAIKLMNNLKIRKSDMLREQLDQQKKLIWKLEQNADSMPQNEKDQLMDLIRSLQDSIENIKKDLETRKPALGGFQRNKTETQKEILDAELDLYNKELEGGDTMALRHKVYELRAQAHASGTFRGRGGYRGSRGFSSRGRGGSMRSLRSVDRRPTKICIKGYPVSRHSEILNYFGQFGSIESIDPDLTVPSLVINYANRKTAELAFANGKAFDGISLDIQWVAKVLPPVPIQKEHANNGEMTQQEESEAVGSPEGDELGEMYDDQMALYDQYEEEEDDEVERSWRR